MHKGGAREFLLMLTSKSADARAIAFYDVSVNLFIFYDSGYPHGLFIQDVRKASGSSAKQQQPLLSSSS